jgi:heme/copper-type cytochrome/quinol oxidase subunit 1
VAQDKPRKDPFERRTIWVFALAIIAFVFPSLGFAFSDGAEWWNVTLWIAGETAVVLAIGAAGLALMPRRSFLPAVARRDPADLVSVGILLLWLGFALILINLSIVSIVAIGEPEF